MNKPIVSIVVATYNSDKTLSKTLDSIVSQRFTQWECIVVDGGSKDNTLDILRDYQQRDKRISFKSEPDKGIYDAFNKGWRRAVGIWVFYLGSDDIITQDGLYNILQEETDADVLYGNPLYSRYDGRRISSRVAPEPNCMKGRMVNHQCILMKRKVIEELGGFDITYKICGDFDLFQRAYMKGYKFEHRNFNIGRFSSGGATGASFRNLREAYKVRLTNGCCSKAQSMYLYAKSFIIKAYRVYIKSKLVALYLNVKKYETK